MSDFEFEVCDGHTFRDLCGEIITRSTQKKDQVDTLIGDMRTLIKGPNDVAQYMPRIKELLEVGVKNDEQLIKLAAVVQRIHSTQIEVMGGEGSGLTDDEKERLLKDHLAEAENTLKGINKDVETSIPK